MNQEFSLMQKALELAREAAAHDEVPVGALIIDPKGELIAQARNRREEDQDPLGHAELLAMKEASKKLNSWRLENCTLYVTLEPCPMCLAAMREARIEKVVFGAYDSKGGALSRGYSLHQDERLNHRFQVVGGILQSEAAALLSTFFKQKRASQAKTSSGR